LPRDPGVSYEYSNFGMGLLGHALALRSGQDFENLLTERVTTVLNLPNTTITLNHEQEHRLTKGYTGVIALPNWDWGVLSGAGSLHSSARDLTAFLALNMELASSPLSPAMALARQPRASSPNGQIGLGWELTTTSAGLVVWHGGLTWGYNCFAGFILAKKLGVVVLANSDYEVAQLGFHLLDPSVPLAAVPIPAQVPVATLQKYVGHYQFDPQNYFDIALLHDHLTLKYSGDFSAYTLYPSSVKSFFLTKVTASADFESNAQGIATNLVWHQNGQTTSWRKMPVPARLTLRRQEGQIQLTFTGDTGVNYLVEARTNLADPATWTPISTNTIWRQPVVIPAADQDKQRFLRLRRE
jgi:serine-type D-Ala-D-Ala carboxypeptidase/endopeptidase